LFKHGDANSEGEGDEKGLHTLAYLHGLTIGMQIQEEDFDDTRWPLQLDVCITHGVFSMTTLQITAEPECKVLMVGDTHGQLHDVVHM